MKAWAHGWVQPARDESRDLRWRHVWRDKRPSSTTQPTQSSSVIRPRPVFHSMLCDEFYGLARTSTIHQVDEISILELRLSPGSPGFLHRLCPAAAPARYICPPPPCTEPTRRKKAVTQPPRPNAVPWHDVSSARVLAMHVCACYGRAERTVAHHAVRLLCFTPADVRGRDHKWSPCCHRIRLRRRRRIWGRAWS